MNKATERWAEALIIGLVFLVPIAVYRPAYDWVLIKLLIAQVLTAGILLYLLFKKEEKLNSSFLDITILAYGAISLISLTFSEYKYASLGEFNRVFTYILIYFSVRHFSAQINLKNVTTAWIVSTIIACLYGLIGFTKNRLMLATFGNQNFTAGYLVLILPLVLILFYQAFRKGSLRDKVFFPTSFVLILITLTLCQARSGWFALGIGLSLLLVFSCAGQIKKLLLLLLIIIIVVSLIYILLGEKFLTILFNDIRPWIWNSSWSMWKERLVFGYGLGTYPIYNLKFRTREYLQHPQATALTEHAHCEFLEIACETGIVGLICFLAIILTFFISSFQKIRYLEGDTKTLCIGIVSGMSALLAYNLMDVNMRFTSSGVFFWFSLGLVSGLSDKTKPVTAPSSVISRHPAYRSGLIIALLILAWVIIRTFTVDFMSNIYLRSGIIMRNRGDWTSAIDYYKEALKANPYLIPAYQRLSYAYGELGDYEKTAWANQKILELSPYHGSAYKNLGVIYYHQGRLDEALRYLQYAYRLLPSDLDILCSLGSIYMKTGNIKEATLFFLKALVLAPDNSYAKEMLNNIKQS